MRKLLDQGEPVGDPDDMFGVLLLQNVIEELRSVERAQATLGLTKKGLDLRLGLKGTKAEPSWGSATRSWTPLIEPRGEDYAYLHLDRDIAEFWAAQDDWVNDATRDGLAEFAQTTNIFFAGTGIDPVFAKLGRGFDVIVGRNPSQRDLQIPAFAIVFPEEMEEDFEERFLVGFQTTIGIVNADAGSKGRQPMLMEQRMVGNVAIHRARFLDDPVKGRNDLPYNFSPSMAFVRGRLVIASEDRLLERIIRAPEPDAEERQGDALVVNLAAGARALADNRAALVDQRLLDRGESEDDAAAAVDAMIRSLRELGRLELEHIQSEGASRYRR